MAIISDDTVAGLDTMELKVSPSGESAGVQRNKTPKTMNTIHDYSGNQRVRHIAFLRAHQPELSDLAKSASAISGRGFVLVEPREVPVEFWSSDQRTAEMQLQCESTAAYVAASSVVEIANEAGWQSDLAATVKEYDPRRQMVVAIARGEGGVSIYRMAIEVR